MTDYMGMYNERFMKRAPQYGANARARTYQDYMRNIQAQRMAAGQTFGNLAMQQQNQSFYDRAMGRPPGLSGGMAQQFQNQMTAARSRQLGQTAQQRYQAFADISAQEAQASQFARAEAAAEQQFQAQELQFNAQKQAQAQQIMSSPNLTFEQKQDQLSNLGLTQGQIERMSPSQGSAIIGGTVSTVAGVGGAIALPVYTYRSSNITALRGVVEGDAGVQGAQTTLDTAREALKNGPQAAAEGRPAVTMEELVQNVKDAEKGLADKKSALVDQIAQGVDAKELSRLEGLKGDKAKALADFVKDKNIDVTKLDTLDDAVRLEYDKLLDASQKAASAADDAAAAGLKAKGAGVTMKTKGAVAGVKTKILAAKGAGWKAFGAIAKVSGVIFLAYMALEGLSMAATGTGLLEGVGNLLSGNQYVTPGKRGLVELVNN